MKYLPIALLALSTAACSMGKADGELEAGQWKQTATIKSVTVPGAPQQVQDALKAMAGKQTTNEHCVTAAEAKSGVKGMATSMQQGQCSTEGFTSANGKISGKVTCKTGKGPDAVMNMTGTYTDKRIEMAADMSTEMPGVPGGKANITMQMVAEHVGQCKKPS